MTLHHGDCLDVMAGMEPESVDAVVTDPPYGLEFMGKSWDRLGAVNRARGDDQSGKHVGSGRGASPTQGRPRFDFGYSNQRRMQEWHARWAREAYRVAKPSAYLLAFGGTRTVHRMTVAIEDAGWVIRDMLVWAYAQGFPKSKASLKPAWEPIVMARKPGPLRELAIDLCRIGTTGGGTECPHWPEACRGHGDERSQNGPTIHVTGPTAIMDTWDDERNLCGSCAEDADSPARLGTPAIRASTTRRHAARQPNDSGMFGATGDGRAISASPGTTAERSATSSSTGESGRTPTGRSLTGLSSTTSTGSRTTTGSRTCISCGAVSTPTTIDGTPFDTATGLHLPTTNGSIGGVGRWPANLVLTDPIFDGGWDGVVGGGETPAGAFPGQYDRNDKTQYRMAAYQDARPTDSGTYSRFFLIPKADRADREPVLGGLPERFRGTLSGESTPRSPRDGQARNGAVRANVHPTVKPVDLMRHLVRLVTPTGGIVLDPFAGSGSTLLAAEQEGFEWIGIEKEREYVAIAEARLNGTQRGLGLPA